MDSEVSGTGGQKACHSRLSGFYILNCQMDIVLGHYSRV
jgi:hypothetical protein